MGFTWTYHYFWGLEALIPQFIALWDKLDTNKIVGGLFPNDGDGNAWGDPELGFPPALEAAGYTMSIPDDTRISRPTSRRRSPPSRMPEPSSSPGFHSPPDFATFWTQAAQQGLTPVGATIGKAHLVPGGGGGS